VRTIPSIVFATAAAFSWATGPDFRGKGKFPQYRNISGLPGGGFCVSPEGAPDVSGALALSTPVAYSLTDYRVVFVYGSQSNDRRFRFDGPRREGIGGTNATGAAMIGVPLGQWRITFTGMFLSSDLDSVLNVHVQPPLSRCGWAVGFGSQDLFSTGGAAGTGHPNDRDLSRSFYIAGTWRSPRGVYVTGGIGTERFRHGFAGASAPLGRSARLSLEQDGFGFNLSAMFETKVFARSERTQGGARIHLGAGLVKLKHPMWSIGTSF
jgi:hypothetical protein